MSFADEAARERWQDGVKAAFRWLADSGFGGERSRGWGRSDTPEFTEGTLPEMILPEVRPADGDTPIGFCRCSHPRPRIGRLGRGDYAVVERGGRVDSPAGRGR